VTTPPRETLYKISRNSYFRYGEAVNQKRAFVDFRDGLKPVTRRILFAMHELKLRHDGGRMKAARIVGDVMGKYHPHGDLSIFDATVTAARGLPISLVDGDGNWGSFDDGPGAMRYIEARLSVYSDLIMLDKEYLVEGVIPFVCSYDGKQREPLYLPARLPTVLLTGPSGIGVGFNSNIPAFAPQGVVKLLIAAFRGKPVTPGLCARFLKVVYTWGGICTATREQYLNLFKTGTGSLPAKCDYVVDPRKRTITITGVPDGWFWPVKRAKVLENERVADFGLESSQAGNLELVIYITAKATRDFNTAVAELEPLLTCSNGYNFRVVENKVKDDDSGEWFSEPSMMSVVDLIERWMEYRVALELAVLRRRRSQIREEIQRLLLLKVACTRLSDIFKVLQSKGTKDEKLHRLAELLNVELDAAKQVWAMTVGQLDSMNVHDLNDKLAKVRRELVAVKSAIADPRARIADQMEEMLNVFS
jgi:DNA gyrase/topoisomerase IV subunit A